MTNFTDKEIEIMAEVVHNLYSNYLKKAKPTSRFQAYQELTEIEKQQNREFVQDIPSKLARFSLNLSKTSDESPFIFESDILERLSEMEHARWLKKHEGSYTTNCFAVRPWTELPENEKGKDRWLMCGLPSVLSAAGYFISRTKKGKLQ